MKKPITYIREYKRKFAIESNYRVAKNLELTHSAMTKIKQGGGFDNFTAIKLAERLGVEPMEIIAAASFQRAKNDKEKNYWEKVWKACATVLIATSCALALPFQPAEASISQQLGNNFQPTIIYIMRNSPNTSLY